jgi:phosphosulfolactate phosphohydrolase-like enzyme
LETAKKKLHGRKVRLIAVGSRYGLVEDLAVVLALYSSLNGLELSKQWVRKSVLNSKAARHLREIGYGKDVEFAVNRSYKVLPKLEYGIVKSKNAKVN